MDAERRFGVASREEIADLTGLEMLAGDDRGRAARAADRGDAGLPPGRGRARPGGVRGRGRGRICSTRSAGSMAASR